MKSEPCKDPALIGLEAEALRHSLRRPDGRRNVVNVGDVAIGGERIVIAAGPCAVEPNDSLRLTALGVASAGATILRGGAYKPRTSPYDFQGLEKEGLLLLDEVRAETGLPVVTEVLDPRDVDLVASHADMLQVGSRSVQNVPLLREVGASGHPVLLKRGLMTTVFEWLSAAEYIIEAGGGDAPVVLCERGIRTFETATRNTLDLNAVALLRELSRLPLIVDPSHGTGRADLVPAMSRASLAAGADGLLVEVHASPGDSWSDAAQTLGLSSFAKLVGECRTLALALGRDL